jgi:hypothetical protein
VAGTAEEAKSPRSDATDRPPGSPRRRGSGGSGGPAGRPAAFTRTGPVWRWGSGRARRGGPTVGGGPVGATRVVGGPGLAGADAESSRAGAAPSWRCRHGARGRPTRSRWWSGMVPARSSAAAGPVGATPVVCAHRSPAGGRGAIVQPGFARAAPLLRGEAVDAAADAGGPRRGTGGVSGRGDSRPAGAGRDRRWERGRREARRGRRPRLRPTGPAFAFADMTSVIGAARSCHRGAGKDASPGRDIAVYQGGPGPARVWT